MADYEYYFECETDGCTSQVSYWSGKSKCVRCIEDNNTQNRLASLRPLIKQVLREEGLID